MAFFFSLLKSFFTNPLTSDIIAAIFDKIRDFLWQLQLWPLLVARMWENPHYLIALLVQEMR